MVDGIFLRQANKRETMRTYFILFAVLFCMSITNGQSKTGKTSKEGPKKSEKAIPPKNEKKTAKILLFKNSRVKKELRFTPKGKRSKLA